MATRKEANTDRWQYPAYVHWFHIENGDEDKHRRTFILRILLASLILLSLIAAAIIEINHGLLNQPSVGSSPWTPLVLAALCLIFWKASSSRYYGLAAQLFIGLLAATGTYMLIGWGVNLVAGILIYALVVVMTGILISSRYAACLTIGLGALLIVLAWLESSGRTHPNLSIQAHTVTTGDGVGYGLTLGVIAVVSWLSNREIDRSLERARGSERELKYERDNLETTVAERTRALQTAQIERILELERFAEFGHLNAGLIHDIASPLTVLSLNLEQLGAKRQSEALKEALSSMATLRQYLENARTYLQGGGELRQFDVETEMQHVLSMLARQAARSQARPRLVVEKQASIHGDPVLFRRIVANLMTNAIEAYDSSVAKRDRRVVAEAAVESEWLMLSVQDWGHGIASDRLDQVFEPFYTTKSSGAQNSGIGLGIVKRLVENDFHGKVSVTSTAQAGTKFTVRLRLDTRGPNDGTSK